MDTRQVLARNFGLWLDRKMAARDWNGADLARAIERAGGRAQPSDISRYRQGKRRPSPETLEYIADALNVPHQEAMEAAGYVPRLPMEHLERWHAALDPLLKRIAYDEENVFNMRSEAERIIRVQEMRAGKRAGELGRDVNTDEEA